MLLSRVADSLFWGARYLERAEDTARVVRAYTDALVDLPTTVTSSWEPLLAMSGSRAAFELTHERPDEASVVSFLVADMSNAGSVAASIASSRENLRTTREVFPRDAWQTINDLLLYMGSNAEAGVSRRSRSRVLNRVISDSLQLDGVLTATMNRDEAYEVWRLGQSIERADMTTRVLGVRAAALLSQPAAADDHDEVQWMGVLRSLAALQMFQLATRGPISGGGAVQFLLHDRRFPRSVAASVQRIRDAFQQLPHPERTLPAVGAVEALLRALPADLDDGNALDAAMDQVQVALFAIADVATATFVRSVD